MASTLKRPARKTLHQLRIAHRQGWVSNLADDLPRTRDKFLRQRTSPLVGSHVDAIFYCTGGAFNMYRHHSQETELYKDSGSDPDWGWQLGLDGPDVLQTMVDFGHRRYIRLDSASVL